VVCGREAFNHPRRTDKPGPGLFLTKEASYEVENPRRVGGLERDEPIPARFKALRHRMHRDLFGFGH
jgi:hypothetical protein